MAVLSRVNWLPQLRVDLSHFLAAESYTAFDIRSIMTLFGGVDRPYVVRGLFASAKTGLTISFSAADSMVINPNDSTGSFYVGLPSDADISLTLPANQANLFIEARFVTTTQAPTSQGFWDPLALSGQDASGDEFSSAADTQVVTVLEISANTVEFSDNAIPLAIASTDASTITSLRDYRNLLFRLGTPADPLHKYEFGTTRAEPVSAGTGTGELDSTSPWRSSDATGQRNDKGIKSFKDFIDMVTTRISEIDGNPLWYLGSSSGLSLSNLHFDTIGHSIQPQENSSFIWKTVSGGLRLCGEGDVALSGGARQIGLVRWQANYSGLQWHLGHTFTGSGYRSYTSVKFQSPVPADNGNIYLQLERDVAKGSGNAVDWASNASELSFTASKAVSGQAGDFTGIALGDYIRKVSEGTEKYYLVQKMSDGTTVYQNTGTEQNKIADATIIALELVDPNDPAGTISSGTSSEPLRYFRSRYISSDLVADTSAGTYLNQGTKYYWLGRRLGSLFRLRDYGNMQEGEEVATIEDSWKIQTGDGSLFYQHAPAAEYTSINGYRLTGGGPGTLLTIGRRRQDNSVEAPGSGDNSDGWLEFTIAAPVGTMNVGDGLWVRLSDSTDGALSNGSVTDATDASDNTATTDNRWEIRTQANNVLRTWDTRNVYLVARRTTVTIEGSPVAALQFADGSILSANGQVFETNLQVRTFKFTDYAIDTITPTTNVTLMGSLTNAELRLGGINTTVRVRGDLIVDGNMSAIQTTQIQADDKLISLGVGLLADEAYGAGIEVADDTKTATSYATTNGSPDVVITFGAGALTSYVLGDEFGLSPGDSIGGITAGQMGGVYTIVATLTTVGQATKSGDQLTIRTSGTATSTGSSSSNTPRAFKSPWSIKVGASDGDYDAVTSWIFRIKGVATAPALTPVSSYGTVPTAHTTNMVSTRIPFANPDGAGPGGADTTLNFDANLTFDPATSKLTTANLKTTQGVELTRVAAKTADYTLTTQDVTVPFDTSGAGADVLANLPAATGSGRIYIIKDVGGQSSQFGKNIIITPNGADTIDDDVDYTIRHNYEGVILQDILAGKWYVVTKTAGSGTGTVLVDLYDPINTTLPSGPTATIDGVSVANNDLVFFTNLSVGNEQIYQASGVGVSIVWSPLAKFADDQFTPAAGETVRVTRGTLFADQLVLKTDAGEFLINDTVRHFDGNKGTDFWELSSLKTTTLTDNTVAGEIFSVAVAGSENMIVSYSIVRASGQKETGEIYITSDGTTAQLAVANAYMSSVGVTFTAAVVTGNLKLRYDTTSTGSNATMKYFVKRWSDSPGGPTGIPSYSGGGGSPVSAAGATYDVQYKGTGGNLDADTAFKWSPTEQAIELDGLLIGKLNGPVVLLDNQVSPVTIFTFPVANKWAIIEYGLSRDADTQVGRLLVTNNGTITSISDDSVSTILSLGVTFSADISGGNVRIRYTSTSTGFNASFKYSYRRWQ